MNFKRCLLIMIILFMTVILVGCKPVYTVIFYDHDGNIISEQMVKEGDSAIAPMMPYKEDFEFIVGDCGVIYFFIKKEDATKTNIIELIPEEVKSKISYDDISSKVGNF